LMEWLREAPDESTPAAGTPRVAAVILSGSVSMSGPSGSLLGGERIGVDATERTLDQLAREPDVRAVVIRVASPGGSALASGVIWSAVRRLRQKRPVVASVGDVAASGGYYIASAADRIVAAPGALTGSIGVVGGKIVLGALFERLGIRAESLSRGSHATLE